VQGIGVRPAIARLAEELHLCGYAAYEDFAKTHQVPVVVTGFEPLDLLAGLSECVHLLESRRNEVVSRQIAPVTIRRLLGRDQPLDEPSGATFPRIC
jgi:hypothetical protein